VTSTILRTEFLLQIRKQWEDSAILLASNRPQNKDQTKKQRKTEREKNRGRQRTEEDKEQGKTGEDKEQEQEQEQVGLQEAPHLHDPKQNHSENAKSRNSKQEFFLKNQPSSSL
jgi:hypothetical protein